VGSRLWIFRCWPADASKLYALWPLPDFGVRGRAGAGFSLATRPFLFCSDALAGNRSAIGGCALNLNITHIAMNRFLEYRFVCLVRELRLIVVDLHRGGLIYVNEACESAGLILRKNNTNIFCDPSSARGR
jgi:hypothetical protein